MEAESNVNQISNIDLAEEVTEETPQPVQNHTPEIDEERRKEMMEEITKLENEIVTIKQALQRKETQLAKLRQELGLTRWSKIQNSQAVSKSKQALSDAGAKTGQALRSFGTATANKWTEINENISNNQAITKVLQVNMTSERVQSMSEKFWATTGAVKAKLVGGEQKELQEPPPAEIAQSKESPSPI